MKTYLVSLKIQAGEYEKGSEYLIQADNITLATDWAIYLESHDTDRLEWDNTGAADLGWEFHYQGNGVTEIEPEDVTTLAKYLHLHTCDNEALSNCSNWLDHA